jgi:hypothetical protein
MPSASPAWVKSRSGPRTSSAGTVDGMPCTSATREPCAVPAAARIVSICAATAWARAAISASLTFGLATVSISAEVSPKSLTKSIGPAPSGRSVIESSFSLMSSNSFGTSAVPSTSVM